MIQHGMTTLSEAVKEYADNIHGATAIVNMLPNAGFGMEDGEVLEFARRYRSWRDAGSDVNAAKQAALDGSEVEE